MPTWNAVMVKPREGKVEGMAVLVPMDAAAAADPASEAAESYKGTDGKPLLTRTMPRLQMEGHLKMIEELHHWGNKHRDVQNGRIADASEEIKRLRTLLDGSFKVGALPDPSSFSHDIVGSAAWSCDEAKFAATNSHKGVADKCLSDLVKSGKGTVEEYLRIATATKHDSVSLEAVVQAIEKGAPKESLLLAAETIQHEEAALMAFQEARGKIKAK